MLENWHLWIISGLLLWIIEIFTPGFVAGVFGTACLLVSPFAYANLSLKLQLLIFGIATAIVAFGVRPLMLKHFYGQEAKTQTNVDALLGKSGLVTEMIDNAAGTGRVKLGGEIWRAVTTDNTRVETGQEVVVQGIEGCKVLVKTVTKNEGGKLT